MTLLTFSPLRPAIQRSLSPWALALLPVLLPLQSHANTQAVQAATDAFGTSVGRESIGLYTTSSVRGFSPTAAGNVRIDGLYFDQVWSVSARLRTASQVRVGLSAQGFVFPAPTGIVDHQLRRPGSQGSGRLELSADHWGSRYLDLDFAQPLKNSDWGVTGGVSLQHAEFPNGTDSNAWNASLGLWWRPQVGREALVFFSRHATTHDQIGPLFSSGSNSLPPLGPRRQFDGPEWAAYRGVGLNRGLMLSEQLAPDWQLRLGLFHSEFDDARSVSNLFLDLQPDGQGRRLLIIDPRARVASDSGELRLSHRFGPQDWPQRLHLQLAGRARQRQSGGSVTLDLGPRRLGEAIELSEPTFAFGPQALDRVHQNWLGLAYELRHRQSLEFSAGLQKSHYRKDFARPGQAKVEDRAAPWLANLGGAWHLSPTLAAYAGWTRGLEESGVAPGHASNRNQALPAILTRQHDAGLRWQMGPRLKLVAGLFEVRKPYFNLDAANLFTQLGTVRHRGAEISFSGHPSPELRLLAGAVLMQPRVLGEGVSLGRVGERPVGQPERTLKLNAVWTPPVLGGVSLDAALSHLSAMAATRDNRVELPANTELDLGVRLPFNAAPWPMSARLSVTNVADHRSFELRGSGSFAERPGRLVSLSVSSSW
ncbi:iron complex outermembrane receptor protein [Inhella inkyongensis]|uniref:Iron complex outermembrane receptor protein n=1 Tax=Inhella inkyongensis TaxID=392593 RepID=A0A840RZL5_9BURK|nr:TonB-dependent receptor [Inhella inkyongensis]MBB5202993.1 iron complex outermembrane receptor protein [Inhella inkyongensis]